MQLRWKLSTSNLPASPGKARIIEGVDKVYHKKLEGGIRHNTWICILPRSKKCPPLVIFSKWIYTRSISGPPCPHIPQVDISDREWKVTIINFIICNGVGYFLHSKSEGKGVDFPLSTLWRHVINHHSIHFRDVQGPIPYSSGNFPLHWIIRVIRPIKK